MKTPIELYIKAGDDPDVRIARHNADNKLCAVQMCQDLLERAKTTEARELYTKKMIETLSKCSVAFGRYMQLREHVYFGLLLAEGYQFGVALHNENDIQNVIPINKGEKANVGQNSRKDKTR